MATRRRDIVPTREMRATLTSPCRLAKSKDPSSPAHLNPTLQHATTDVPKQHDQKLSPIRNLAKDRRTNTEKKTPTQNIRHPSINQTLQSPASSSWSSLSTPLRAPLPSTKIIPSRKPVQNKTFPSPKHVKSITISSSKPSQSKTLASSKPVQGKTIASSKPVQNRTINNRKPVQGKTTLSQKPSKDKNSKTSTKDVGKSPSLQTRPVSILKKRGPSIGVMKQGTKTTASAIKEQVTTSHPHKKDTNREESEVDSPYQEFSSSEAEEQTIEVAQSYNEMGTVDLVPKVQEPLNTVQIEAENNDENADIATAEPLTVLEQLNDTDAEEMEDKPCIVESSSMEKETEELIVEEINNSITGEFGLYDDNEVAKEKVLILEETIMDKTEEMALDDKEVLSASAGKLQESWRPEKRVVVEDSKNEPEKPQVIGKKDSIISNDVIEETASMLREQRKNRVRALAGAFETVISLQ